MDAGFRRKTAVRAARLLLAYIEAHVVDEIDDWLGVEDQSELATLLAAGPFPVTADLIEEIARPDHDADFTFELNVLIDGMAKTYERDLQAP